MVMLHLSEHCEQGGEQAPVIAGPPTLLVPWLYMGCRSPTISDTGSGREPRLPEPGGTRATGMGRGPDFDTVVEGTVPLDRRL